VPVLIKKRVPEVEAKQLLSYVHRLCVPMLAFIVWWDTYTKDEGCFLAKNMYMYRMLQQHSTTLLELRIPPYCGGWCSRGTWDEEEVFDDTISPF
jgi:hypothetical protein